MAQTQTATIQAVYNPSAGNVLLSTGTVIDTAALSANGLAFKDTGLVALPPFWHWDTTNLVVVSDPAPSATVLAADWIMAFTAAEYSAMKASSDQNVQQFLFAIEAAVTINLNKPLITNGLAYLVSINLLAAARVPQLLAVQSS